MSDAIRKSFEASNHWQDEGLDSWLAPAGDSGPARCRSAALTAVAARLITNVDIDLYYTERECESPIESMMLYSLYAAGQNHFDQVLLGDRAPEGSDSPLVLCVVPQVRIGDYRVDFLLRGFEVRHTDRGRRWIESQMVVECDGHDFHEKTREQARRDKARDRRLQSFGLPVYRYTGSEIWRDPFGCASQAAEDLCDRLYQRSAGGS